MKLLTMLMVLFCSTLAYHVSAEEKSCAGELGKKPSDTLVKWCINVSPATHPPCNSNNACNLITDEIKRGCGFLKNETSPPGYCVLIYQNANFNISSFAADPSQKDLIKLAKDALEKELFSNATDSEISFGDINKDGIVDFAALVEDPEDHELKIVLFLGDKNKSFKFYQSSGDTFKHDRVSQEVQIKKDAVFLHRDASGGCCSHWAEDFQFKLRGNEMVLVGLEVTKLVAGDLPNDSGRSVNFITSEMVSWQQNGKHRTEKKVKFPSSELIKLGNFNYDAFTSTAPKGVYK